MSTDDRHRFTGRWILLAVLLAIVQVGLWIELGTRHRVATQLRPDPARTLLLLELTATLLTAFLLAGIARARRVALPAVLLNILLAGWWLTRTLTGAPLDATSLGFLAENPRAVLLHGLDMDPAAMVIAGIAIPLGALLLVAAHDLAPRIDRKWAIVPVVALALVGTISLRGARSLAASPRQLFDPETGVTREWRLVWEESRSRGAGPLTALLGMALGAVRGPGDTFPRLDPAVEVFQPPMTGAELQDSVVPRRRNVLIVVIESLRGDVLRAGGADEVTMPALEGFAGEARQFTNAIAVSSQSNLAAVIPVSGQYPLRTTAPAAYPDDPPYPRTLLWDLVHDHGWRTAVFSSQNERWWRMRNFLVTPSLDTLHDAESAPSESYLPEGDLGFARFARGGRAAGKLPDHVTVSAAIDWIRMEPRSPFLMLINLQSSHLPYRIPPDAPHRFPIGGDFPIHFGGWPRDSVDAVHTRYRNALAHIDTQLERLWTTLRGEGLLDSTIVVVTGDHGQGFYEHGLSAHANGLWQELLSVPLIIRAPGITPGLDSRAASHLDVAPTVASLLGFSATTAWPGQALDRPEGDAPPVFLLVQSPLAQQTGVIWNGWKLVRDRITGAMDLHDLGCDPLERHNLVSEAIPERDALVALLRSHEQVQFEYYASPLRMATELPPRILGLADQDRLRAPAPRGCGPITADTAAAPSTAPTAP